MALTPPDLALNLRDRARNAVYEAHDPSMFYDPVTDCYYSYATDAAIVSPFTQGVQLRKSPDLIHWSYVGTVLSAAAIAEGRDNGPDFAPTQGFWAPYVEKVGAEYRMYYSATKAFGSSESRIHLAVSDRAEGPFENRGTVVDTWFTDDTYPNAIDPHVMDAPDGRKFFLYGSFFGGIFVKPLDPETGLCLDGDPRAPGRRIARSNANTLEGPEGAAGCHCPETGYYYLFLSYGWLGENYDIRVGRSKDPMGPYRNYRGEPLTERMGLKLAGSYCFSSSALASGGWTWDGFRGPGHGVPFRDPKGGDWYFVHHVRDGAPETYVEHPRAAYTQHYMMVRKMVFVDGWPALSPEPYAGERACDVPPDAPGGRWEIIAFHDENNDTQRSYVVESGEVARAARQLYCWDFENARPGVCLTGIGKDGAAVWGKRLP